MSTPERTPAQQLLDAIESTSRAIGKLEANQSVLMAEIEELKTLLMRYADAYAAITQTNARSQGTGYQSGYYTSASVPPQMAGGDGTHGTDLAARTYARDAQQREALAGFLVTYEQETGQNAAGHLAAPNHEAGDQWRYRGGDPAESGARTVDCGHE